MSQRPITSLILAPAAIYLPPQARESLRVPHPFGMIEPQRLTFLFKACRLLLELINLAARPSLPAIKAASIQEEWPADLRVGFIHRGRGQKRMHAPFGT